jgi:hypothetical protein
MPTKLLVAAVSALLLTPIMAKADLVTGSFSGTMSDGTDTTGVFGTVDADLSGDTIDGTYSYDTALFSQVVSGGTNTATGTGPGALTVSITIDGFTHTFTDNSSSGVFLDDGSVSGNNELTLNNANNQNLGGGSTIGESFTLDAQDPITAFITGTGLDQNFGASPLITSGSFNVLDTGPNVQVDGDFTVSSLTESTGAPAVPEPGSLALLAVGVMGVVGMRRRAYR